ncbi:hypothetical protein SAMD00023353_1301950 [Rosellinia necatrix]|uniref:Uncharacterized protein n=1 Tax=Rosellinia necatrix TaxID=77044 RepID=A0A1W2TC71_ROSNE|nr:hypothetical protein SAMD00023353_1301950 [Rosellinia necatrix]
MPSNSYSSDDSGGGGGAPLHPALATPLAPSQPHKEGSKSESPSDEEKALVRASAKFGSLKDPFAETPEVPRSIPAGTYQPAFPQPTPSRANNNHNHFGNTPASRYHSSTSATSSSVPRPRPGTGSTGFMGVNSYAQDSDQQICQQIFSYIMTATQFVNVSSGIPPPTQSQLIRTLHEISQGFSTVTVQLRKQRDEASRSKEEEHERYKRATHEADQIRKALEKQQELNKALTAQLRNITDRENLRKEHIKDLKQQLHASQKHLENLTSDAVRFHAHHDKVIEDYKEQDEKHFKAMTALEDEVKALRSSSTASNTNTFALLPQPASVDDVAEGECDSKNPTLQKRQGGHNGSTFSHGRQSTAQKAQSGDQKSKGDNFTPNPQAPSWAPTGRPRAMANAGRNAHARSEQQEEDSSSGNSGEIILYSGNSNQNRSVAPYVGPEAQGGAPTYIRTPFGVVFGEYPTVDENARLPGEKMIPRDKEEWEAVDVQRALAHLYDLCKGYVANCHMHNSPNTPYDRLQESESYTWHYLLQQVYKDPEHAASHLRYLLSTKAFVPYLLQRTCVDYLLKKILTPQVFLGFSDAMDNHLRALQGQLANIADTRDRPIHSRSRQRVIEDHAKLIKAIAVSQSVGEFRRRTVDRHATLLSALLEPCRARGTPGDLAQKSLRIMVAACWDISLKVWSSGKTLHYVFPECANKFSPGTMEALNGHHMADRLDRLVHSQCRVSLVVTPTMTLRDDRDAARMQCHAIHKAQVLLMKLAG